ncbi:DUF2946 family protein [Xanthobacter agilis]|uniref:DUF2946 domain-containing protein n=1 Tax=Xanthobacter agilis TaxID=47492 RepID=A0ABU0LGF4_XANAG|nr:DUF2946 family protein [Xanthobacter agilis]MDQ0506232.1 hypothetical protein [Xanthobacter agilis]
MSIAIAYALLLQVVLTGFAAERMAFASSAANALCLTANSASGDGGDDGGTADHAVCCVLCAFAHLTPTLPERVFLANRSVGIASRVEVPRASVFIAGDGRREPRCSQGPPRAA